MEGAKQMALKVKVDGWKLLDFVAASPPHSAKLLALRHANIAVVVDGSGTTFLAPGGLILAATKMIHSANAGAYLDKLVHITKFSRIIAQELIDAAYAKLEGAGGSLASIPTSNASVAGSPSEQIVALESIAAEQKAKKASQVAKSIAEAQGPIKAMDLLSNKKSKKVVPEPKAIQPWGVYQGSASDPVVPLRQGRFLYQPVSGQASRYFLVAADEALQVGARYEESHNKLSVRVEGQKLDVIADTLKEAGFKVVKSGAVPYASIHISSGPSNVYIQRDLGAVLGFIVGVHGHPWLTPPPMAAIVAAFH